ncbi:MAG: 4-alpha-glucanotransferase [Rhodobacteraceae bacterium]|nr:4-alpha-glucanotransferase [Paracoccaceae bacterium]MBR28124.1 4-alpha-glucanotransferase [Paracoccaceae bacterium]
MTDAPLPRLSHGNPARPGVTLDDGGAEIAVHAPDATLVEFCLFDADGRETARLPLPARSGALHHGRLDGLSAGALYGFRAHGPWDPGAAMRFNPAKLLLDPHARAFTAEPVWTDALRAHAPGAPSAPDPRDSAPHMPRSVATRDLPLIDPAERPRRPWSDTVIYEAHVRGLTRLHPEIPEDLRGTYEALAHPAILAHLARLGVTALELLPVQAFMDEPHLVERGLVNYWGYNPFGYFAPSPRYMGPRGAAGLRDAVAALHAAGIEVILDVVYNHTAESHESGPMLAFRGLDDAGYYRHAPGAPDGDYVNDTGCGNTLDLSKPPARQLMRESLAWWAQRIGIDGFRFDLAPVLGRGRDGGFDPGSDLLADLVADPALQGIKLIAEPWDIGPGGYRVGEFPPGWAEWNDRFRDGARRFWQGWAGGAQDLASGLLGSAERFDAGGRAAWASVNFVAAHDGFTLADTTLYAERRNHANGEDNRDGHQGEVSDPMGPEGPGDEGGGDAAREAARVRRRRNLILTVFAAQGTPMLRAGDERGQSQGGNNNAYCQDNETTWLDWQADDAGLTGFAAAAAALRARLPVLRRPVFLHGAPRADGCPDCEWAGLAGGDPDWGAEAPAGYVLVLRGEDGADHAPAALAFNASDHASPLRPPAPGPGLTWALALTTETPDGAPASCDLPDAIPPATALVLEAVPAGSALSRLSARMGIFERYWEVSGREHVAGPDTQTALLRAMGFDLGEDAEADAARLLAGIEAEDAARRLPREAVVEAGVADAFRLSPPLAWTLTLEDGAPLSGAAGAPLPALPPGLHALEAGGEAVLLAAAPPLAPQVAGETGRPRVWGATGAVYALTSARSLGEGDFEDLATAAEGLARLGADFLGVNPVHALGAAHAGISPYSPTSRTALDPRRIALDQVPGFPDCAEARAAIDAEADALAAWRDTEFCDPALAARIRAPALRALFAAFEQGRGADPAAFEAWLAEGGRPRARFATFEALSLAHGEDWRAWPEPFRDPESPQVAEFAAREAAEIRFHAWAQWTASTQLQAAQARAKAAGMGLGLYLDIAVGVRPDGAEAWARPAAFARGVSLGAPPDALNAAGQVWALAPFNPEGLRAARYAPFRDMLRATMAPAGAVRIDHVIGLDRAFWAPENGAPGGYVRFPSALLLALVRIEAARAGCVVVGEDLGTVPDGLRAALDASGLHGCAILQFEGGPPGFRPPADFPARSLASFGTHDTPTLAGWWEAADAELREALGHVDAPAARAMREDRAGSRAALGRLLAETGHAPEGLNPDAPPATLPPELRDAIHGVLAASGSALAAVQIDDALDERRQQNVPGTVNEAPNWRLRHAAPADALDAAPGLRRAAEIFGKARPRT